MLLTIIFFVNNPATTEIYPYLHTRSLHDALPILRRRSMLIRPWRQWLRPRPRPRTRSRRANRRVWRLPQIFQKYRCPSSRRKHPSRRSEEHTSELQSLMRNSYAVFCLKKKNNKLTTHTEYHGNHTYTVLDK